MANIRKLRICRILKLLFNAMPGIWQKQSDAEFAQWLLFVLENDLLFAQILSSSCEEIAIFFISQYISLMLFLNKQEPAKAAKISVCIRSNHLFKEILSLVSRHLNLWVLPKIYLRYAWKIFLIHALILPNIWLR